MVRNNPFDPIVETKTNPFNPVYETTPSIKQESVSQKGVDPALYEQLRLRGNTAETINQNLQPEKTPGVLKTIGSSLVGAAGGLTNQMFKNVRGTSQLLATAAFVPGAISRDKTSTDAMKESLKMAKDVMFNENVSADEGVAQAAQQFLKKYSEPDLVNGGYKPTITNISALAALGFFNIMGDPLFEVGAGLRGAKALKEFATFKKVGEATKVLPEGTSFLKGTTRNLELKVSPDIKIKIQPKTNEIVVKGYQRRIPTQAGLPEGQTSSDVTEIINNVKEATGRDIVARVQGEDLILKPTTPAVQPAPGVIQSSAKIAAQNIPTTKVSSLGGAEIELPVARAVEETFNEGSVSSGFHFAQSPQEWKIIYGNKQWMTNPELAKEVSSELLDAAKQAGMKVSVREAPAGSGQYMTEISLPGVKFNEIEKATKAFNKFADTYKEYKAGVEPSIDVTKPIGELDAQYRATRPGYRKLSEYVDTMLQNGTIHPEEATIIRTLFEGTDDRILNTLKFSDSGRFGSKSIYRETLGQYKSGVNTLKMQKGLARKGTTVPVRTFVHEFGHAGWDLLLNPSERALVTQVFNELGSVGRKQLFKGSSTDYGGKYYARTVKEFFAQSFSDYVLENKIPARQMEPLLKRIAKELWNRLKNLVMRKEEPAVKAMRPVFDKVLAGDASTPLTEFYNKESTTFKQTLQKMFLAPETTAIQGAEQPTLFTKPITKEVPVETLVPLVEKPPIENKTLQQTILDAKKAYDDEQRSNLNPPPPIEFPEEAIDVRKSMANSPMLKNISDYKDIANVKVQFRDVWRNTLQVFGQDGAVADRILLEPLAQAKGRYIDFLNKEKQDLIDNIKFGKESKESKYVQLYGEGKTTREELVEKFGEAKAAEIVKADTFFRGKYDEFINRLNEVEQRIYPNSPYKWTPKKANYYRHFFEATNEFSRLQNILENPIRIDPLLVGITETTQPKSRWASFKQRRNTEATQVDAVGGYINYLKSVSYAINIDPQIGRIREFADVLKRGTGVKKNLNNYIQNLVNVANELSGKTHLLDRAIMEMVPGGRRGLSALNWLNRRVKANTILLSVRSALAQILNLPQGLATAGPINSAKGATMALAQVFKEGPMSKSTFIKERYFRGFSKFDKGILNNSKKFAVWMVGALDEVGTKIIWNGQYKKALNLGLPNPVKVADDATRNLVAGRGIAEKPTIQNSSTFQLLAPFQYEMTNVWWVMEDMAKAKAGLGSKIGQFMMFFVYLYLMDNLFEKITGGRPLLDPIEAIRDGVREIQADQSMAGVVKAGGRLFGEVVSNLPMGQTLGQVYPEYGTTIGGVKLPSRKEFFGSADPTRFGEGLLSTKALSDPLFKIIPGYGGAQIKKTLQGISAVSSGESRTKPSATNPEGVFQYKLDQNFRNYLQGILFGKYALPESVDYYKKQGAPKGSIDTSGGNPFDPQ